MHLHGRLRHGALPHRVGGVAVRTALLLSGGIDSIALAYWKRPDLAITIDYGQAPAPAEIQAATEVCRTLHLAHDVLRIDCSSLGSGDLANRPALSVAPVPEWWPFRNQLLVTLAAAHGLGRGVGHLLLGTVSTDRAHVDGAPAFIEALSALLAMQEGGVTVSAPAVEMTSADLVRSSGIPFGLLAWAHSCHVGTLACGQCRGCAKHFTTTKELGLGPY
jgi:7-cyano-7-deazaguanine synthase